MARGTLGGIVRQAGLARETISAMTEYTVVVTAVEDARQ